MATKESPSKIFRKWDIIDFVSQADQMAIQTVLYLKRINLIACFHFDGLITLYEINTHRPVKTFKAHNGSITSTYFNSKESKLFTQYTGEIKVWDLKHNSFKELACFNVDYSIVYAIELFKKQGTLAVAGEWKGWGRPKKYSTLLLLDLKTEDVICEWKDTATIKSMQKIRYSASKRKYLIACSLTTGFIKLLTCTNGFRCIGMIKAHSEAITKLHITRINDHPFCISESDDKQVNLWNVTSSLRKVRHFEFKKKRLICGSFYRERVMVLVEEYGSKIYFVDIITGVFVREIEIAMQRRILKGITLGHIDKVLIVLDIPKVLYLGIPQENTKNHEQEHQLKSRTY